MRIRVLLILLAALAVITQGQSRSSAPDRRPRATGATSTAQPDDAGYTEQIKKFTTEPFFTTELVNHLPASKLPTPEKVLGHIAGAENYLTYPTDIYRYLRELEK